MPVLIKKKTRVSTDILEEVGLSAPQEPPKRATSPIPVGAKVRIINDRYPWVAAYKPGDVGVVRTWHRPQQPGLSVVPDSDIYTVQLAAPRSKPVVYVEHWMLEVING